ncbi:MAG: AAA family ATPase [Ethanoligenens sp.]
MDQEYDATLQQRLEDFIVASGSQEKAAKALGMSAPWISQYRHGVYKGSITETENRLTEFFKILDEKNEAAKKAEPFLPVEELYRETSISQDVYKAIRFVQLQKGIAALYGDAGIGKTMAAEKYMQDNPSTAIYIQVSPISGTAGNILKLICEALHLPAARSKLDMIINIKNRLDGTDKVLIIDEAQHLQIRALDEIRPLSDPHMTGGRRGIGIALIGNFGVFDRMQGRRQSDYSQLYSRVKMRRSYTTQQVRRKDIELLFPQLAGKTRELNFIFAVCQSRWGIRGGVNVYNNAVAAEDTSINGLEVMAQNLGIGVM